MGAAEGAAPSESAIGSDWITYLDELARLKPPADDAAFQKEVSQAKCEAKLKFTDWLRSKLNVVVNPDSIFDYQVKRIHELKRQLLNALRIVVSYGWLGAYIAVIWDYRGECCVVRTSQLHGRRCRYLI